jgi:hypothetical protein
MEQRTLGTLTHQLRSHASYERTHSGVAVMLENVELHESMLFNGTDTRRFEVNYS